MYPDLSLKNVFLSSFTAWWVYEYPFILHDLCTHNSLGARVRAFKLCLYAMVWI